MKFLKKYFSKKVDAGFFGDPDQSSGGPGEPFD